MAPPRRSVVESARSAAPKTVPKMGPKTRLRPLRLLDARLNRDVHPTTCAAVVMLPTATRMAIRVTTATMTRPTRRTASTKTAAATDPQLRAVMELRASASVVGVVAEAIVVWVEEKARVEEKAVEVLAEIPTVALRPRRSDDFLTAYGHPLQSRETCLTSSRRVLQTSIAGHA